MKFLHTSCLCRFARIIARSCVVQLAEIELGGHTTSQDSAVNTGMGKCLSFAALLHQRAKILRAPTVGYALYAWLVFDGPPDERVSGSARRVSMRRRYACRGEPTPPSITRVLPESY